MTAAIVEAEQHHEEVKFLESLSGVSDDPSLAPIIATFRQAEAARHRSDPTCVSLYAEVALACWPLLPSSDETQVSQVVLSQAAGTVEPQMEKQLRPVSWRLYHHSVERLLQEADRFGLLDPQRGLTLVDADGNKQSIQITRNGFPWTPEDFNQLHAVPAPLRSHLKRYWFDPGLGVPMVAIRQREEAEPHLGKLIPYSATAVLRPVGSGRPNEIRQVNHAEASPAAVLDLHDPLRITQYSDATREWDLTRDVSAPLGFAQSHLNRDNLKSFLNPDRNDEFSGLRMLEPYQPGKIPIVLVHGLLSDRLTWIDLINDLRHSPWISRHYQIWLYQYPTGRPFVLSAAEMRRQLQQAIDELDPQRTDEALSEMVLVGHSMGGLVSKLLVSSSEMQLWNSIASVPIDDVKIPAEKRPQIDAIFFFEPLPFVKRVVFVGSPHQGSKIAEGWIGRLGAKLVHQSRERTKTTKTILHDNPGVFVGLEKHLPTSVDLLRPENPILIATYALPVNPQVKLHTIIGNGHPLRDGTPADGVVPVESARHPGTLSDKLIETSHTQLPDHPETTLEVTRILREHLER